MTRRQPRASTPPKSPEEKKADALRKNAPEPTILSTGGTSYAYPNGGHSPIPGLYGDINPDTDQVELLYYVDPRTKKLMEKKHQQGCPMQLSTCSTDAHKPDCSLYDDITGTVNGSYANNIGSTHTEVTLCSSSMSTKISNGTQISSSQTPRAYEIYSTLPPCDEHCLPLYKDGTFLRHSWQVETFLNHTNARRQQPEGRGQYLLTPDPDRWQNYNWLVIFSDQYSEPLSSYAICTRMLDYYDKFHPNHAPPKRWLGSGWVNGLVELTSDVNQIRGWKNLFIAEKSYQNTLFKGLDCLTQEYVYWFLTGRNTRYHMMPHSGEAFLPPQIGNLDRTLAGQFDISDNVLTSLLLGLPSSLRSTYLLTMMMTLSEVFTRSISSQTLADLPDPALSAQAESQPNQTRASKRARSRSPQEELATPSSSASRPGGKRRKTQASPQTLMPNDTMPHITALVQGALSMARDAARLRRGQTNLATLHTMIQAHFAQRPHFIVPITSPAPLSSIGAMASSSLTEPEPSASSSSSRQRSAASRDNLFDVRASSLVDHDATATRSAPRDNSDNLDGIVPLSTSSRLSDTRTSSTSRRRRRPSMMTLGEASPPRPAQTFADMAPATVDMARNIMRANSERIRRAVAMTSDGALALLPPDHGSDTESSDTETGRPARSPHTPHQARNR